MYVANRRSQQIHSEEEVSKAHKKPSGFIWVFLEFGAQSFRFRQWVFIKRGKERKPARAGLRPIQTPTHAESTDCALL